jgi:hypothetical protein
MFGYYKIDNIEPYLPDPNFFVVTLTFDAGNGYMKEDEDYFISLVQFEQTIPEVPTKTSDLINDGEDGVHPFITAEDVPTPTLQSVTDAGDTTTTAVYLNGGAVVNGFDTTSIVDSSYIVSSNTTTNSSAYIDSTGILSLSADGVNFGSLAVNDITSSVQLQFPDKVAGTYTIATTDDTTLQGVVDNGNTVTGTGGYKSTLDGGDFFVENTILGTKLRITGDGIVYFTNLAGNTTQLSNYGITSSSVNFQFPNKASGPVYTLATTADIPSVTGFVPYTGANQNVNLGEYELKAGQLSLDTSPTGTAVVGTTRWNDTIGSSETTLKGGTVILKNGVDLVARVVNKVTPNATLTKAAYQAVRVSGAQGQRLAVAYAQANNDNNSADTIGLVCETIPTNQEGFIMTVGQLEDINTTGSLQGETWVDGNVLYLSPTTPGALTNIKPTGLTGHIVVMGYVEYAHAVHGKIYVKIMNGWELDELHNVFINSPTNNQGLFYDSADSLWKNETIESALGYTPQQQLVSGTNIKTINGNSVLGSGDLTISGSNIYNADGTLTSARTLTSGGFPLTFTGSNTAASGISRGLNLTHTLVAAANSNVLVGLDLRPTFTNGAFTGVSNFGLRIEQGTQAGNNTSNIVFKRTDVTSVATIGYQGSGWNIFGIWGEATFTTTNAPDLGVFSGTGHTYVKNNLLIGTTSNAGFKLDVNGTARVQGNATIISANPVLNINVTGNNQSSALYLNALDGTPRAGILANLASGEIRYFVGTGGYFPTFYSNNLERMRIATTGNVLINTTTDAGFKLDVNGTARVQAQSALSTDTTFRVRNSADNDNLFDVRNNGVATVKGLAQVISFNLTDRVYIGSNVNNNVIGVNSDNKLFIRSNGNLNIITVANSTVIVTDSISPALTPSSKLTVESTTQGFLPPRMTTTQKNAIATPAVGLIIFDVTLNKLCVRGASAWETVTSL